MKLMTSGASPFVRKVRVMIAEAGLTGRIAEVEVATTPMGPSRDLIAVNPLGKIPALVRDDGPTLYDSRVICRFIDSLSDHDFYPQSRLWDILVLEATADGILDAAVLMVYEARFRDENQRSQAWLDGQWAKTRSRSGGRRIWPGRSTRARSRWAALWAISTSGTARATGGMAVRIWRPGSTALRSARR